MGRFLNVEPGHFPDRIVFMAMFNDIELCEKEFEKFWLNNARDVALPAYKFQLRHHCFCGPADERIWWALNSNGSKGSWDVVAKKMTWTFSKIVLLILFLLFSFFDDGRIIDWGWRCSNFTFKQQNFAKGCSSKCHWLAIYWVFVKLFDCHNTEVMPRNQESESRHRLDVTPEKSSNVNGFRELRDRRKIVEKGQDVNTKQCWRQDRYIYLVSMM